MTGAPGPGAGVAEGMIYLHRDHLGSVVAVTTIPDPANMQAFNRYSYGVNNPCLIEQRVLGAMPRPLNSDRENVFDWHAESRQQVVSREQIGARVYLRLEQAAIAAHL